MMHGTTNIKLKIAFVFLLNYLEKLPLFVEVCVVMLTTLTQCDLKF